MKNLISLIFAFSAFLPGNLFAQPDTLVGLIDGKLIKINQNDAGIAAFVTITGTPANYVGLRLSYNSADSCFYTISDTSQPGGQDGIAKIDQNGVWTDLGPITVPGHTVYFMESVTHNPFNGLIYVTASLNGNQPSDYWSETLLVVDLGTMTGSIVGTFQHTGTQYEAECDNITFGPNNVMYYNDTEPGGPQFKYVLEQELTFLTPPVLLHEEYFTTGALDGMTFRDEKLYFTVNRSLRVIDLLSGNHSNLGTMFSASDFNGNVIRGLSWMGDKREIHGEPVAISEIDGIDITVFPNPSNGSFNIKIPEGHSYTLTLHSTEGRRIASYNLSQTNNLIEIDQSPGTYMLTVYGRGLSKTIRLVIE